MIAATYITIIFVWGLIRILRDWVIEKLMVDLIAIAGLYFVTKFFIERTI